MKHACSVELRSPQAVDQQIVTNTAGIACMDWSLE